MLKRVLAVGKPLHDPLIDVMTEQPASVRINEPIRTLSDAWAGVRLHAQVADGVGVALSHAGR